MPVTTISSEAQYKDVLSSSGASAIQFMAPWDASSKAIAPAFRKQSDKHADVSFYRVDICDQQDVAMDSGVKLAPTFRMFRDGKQADEYVGSNPHELERHLAAFVKKQ